MANNYNPNASYYGNYSSYYGTPPPNPQPPAPAAPAASGSFYGGGSYYAPAAPAHPPPLSHQGSYYSPNPYAPTAPTYDHTASYTGLATGGYGAQPAPSAYTPSAYNPGAYNSTPAPSMPHSDSGLPLPNFGATSYHSPAPAAYHSPQPPAPSGGAGLPLPPSSPVSASGASSWVEEEKRRVEEEMRRLTVSARPYDSAGYGMPPPNPTAAAPGPAAPYVDAKADEERIRREVEAKVRAEEQTRLKEMEAKLEAERRAREDAEQRRQREEEERRRLESMHATEAAQAREAQMAAQRSEELRQQEAKMRAENEELRRRMEADYEAKMRQLEQERSQREAQLLEEAKRARVQAEQKLMETFARRQQTEEDKRRREEADRRAREEREVERLRAQAEELRRQHEEEVARAVTALQRSDARKSNLAQAEVERLKGEMEAKFKREEEERIRKYEAEKKARSAGSARWEIDPAQIERGKMLGKGAFGEVFRGKLHGKEVAVKVLTKQDIDEETLADFRREVDIMMNLHHPNILLFMGACTRTGHLTIVTELMPRGSVEDIIHSKEDYSLPFRLGLAKGAALGMNWLHSQKPTFLHLDLKPANLLVDQNWVVKVADFGMSQIKGASSGGIFGSPFYMAPEMLLEKGFDEKVDVYSFGIVLWEMVTRAEPYEGLFKNFDQLADGVGLEKIRPRIPADVHPTLKELITQLWDHDPRRRPSFADILRTSALDNVVLNISITDHQGRAFWKANWIDRDAISPWATFVDGMKAYFRIPQMDPLREKCLRLMLTGTRDGDKVTLKQWNDLLSWFGPLTDSSEKAALSVMERVVWLMNHNWFHGDLTQVEAESLLAKQKRGVIRVKEEGFWLVRLGNPGWFVLSVVASDKGVVHHEIKNQSSVLNAEGKHFQTWDDLINWAKKEWKFSLNAICPGSKYETFLLAAAAQQQAPGLARKK